MEDPASRAFVERHRPGDSDALLQIGPDGMVGSWNDDARSLFGYPSERVLGRPFAALFTADCRDVVDDLTLATEYEPRHAVATAIDSDDVRFEAELIAIETSAGIVHYVRDIGERGAIEASLDACTAPRNTTGTVRQLAEQMRAWIAHAELLLGVIGRDRYRVTYGNPAAALHALDDESPFDLASPLRPVAEDAKHVVVQDTAVGTFSVDRVLADAGVRSYVLMPLVADDRVFATLNVSFGEPGAVTPRIVRRLAAVAEAIGTPLARRIEFEDMARGVWRRDQLVRLQRDSVALITHDMGTPLSVIVATADSLREEWTELAEGTRLEGIDAIVRNGEKLMRLVEQDLQLALIDGQELPYAICAFDLAPQIERIVDDLATTTDARFSVQIERPLPLVRADEQRSWQILANLLSNAVKFSPAGTLIDVGAVARNGMVHVSVRDHGRGIADGDVGKLFRKFSRVKGADDSSAHGTGLGLYLSKRMVEAQGGEIWVDSEPGAGSTFTYTLPRAALTPSEE
jgi:PAS domain S-box-containing protein